jgi:hypothetical protein
MMAQPWTKGRPGRVEHGAVGRLPDQGRDRVAHHELPLSPSLGGDEDRRRVVAPGAGRRTGEGIEVAPGVAIQHAHRADAAEVNTREGAVV